MIDVVESRRDLDGDGMTPNGSTVIAPHERWVAAYPPAKHRIQILISFTTMLRQYPS